MAQKPDLYREIEKVYNWRSGDISVESLSNKCQLLNIYHISDYASERLII